MAALSPGCDVVFLGPVGWVLAAGEGAAVVSGDQGEGLGFGGQALGAAVVENRAGAVVDYPGDGGFVGQPQGLRHGQLLAVGGVGEAGAGFELVGGHGDEDGGGYAAGAGQFARA